MACVSQIGCKKDDDDSSDVQQPTSEYYFLTKIDGQNIGYELDASGNVAMSNGTDSSIDLPFCSYSYSCAIGDARGDDAPYFEVFFPDLFAGDCGNAATQFSGLFHTGAYAYGLTTGKVLIRYFDGTEVWVSDPTKQSGSGFEVTASQRTDTPFGAYQKVCGKGSCQLYNEAGQSKKLENVQFCMSFTQL